MPNNQQKEINQTAPVVNNGITKTRLAYIDNLKAMAIIFIVILHACITYSGLGRWFYMEPRVGGVATTYFFAFIQAFIQAYALSLFFMISAYFIPRSLHRKGTKKFILDRLFRLLVPTLIFIFVLFPIIMKIAHPEIDIIPFYFKGITSFDFLSWTGPMWFVVALLFFSILYCFIDSWMTQFANRLSFTIRSLLIFIALITFSAFFIRLIYPIGTAFYNFQFGYFAAYIFMFLAGAIAYKRDLFESLDYKRAIKWFIAAFGMGLPLFFLIAHFAIDKTGSVDPGVFGGWNKLAFSFAFWESFFCVAVIIGLIGIFKRFLNSQNGFQKYLSNNAFGVFVFHSLTLVTVAVLFKDLHIHPILKFLIVISIVLPITFIFSSLVRKVRIFRKIFS